MFESRFKELGKAALPTFSDTRVMMLPVIIGNPGSLPDTLQHWGPAFNSLSHMADARHIGQVGYLTIDEKLVHPGKTHRRQGLHVDGVYRGACGSWGGGTGGSWGGGSGGGSWGGGGGGWGSVGNGMLTVASHIGCRAWNQDFAGWPGNEGECDHLAAQCKPESETVFQPNTVYWVDGLCVHESMPMTSQSKRQFVRLSMPSTAPWFEGYTVNPKGVMPTGPILPRRDFMDQ